MMKRRFITSLCAMLVLSALCFSQTTAQTARRASSPPTLDQILDHYESAIGGRDAWNKLTTRIMRGTLVFSPSGQEATVVVYRQFPNKILEVTTMSPQRKVEVGFDGEIAWSKDTSQGVRRLTGLQFDMTRNMAHFNEIIMLNEEFPHMELLGTKRINGRAAYMIQANTAEGYKATMYFDLETGLRVRLSSTGANGQPFDDYIEEYCDLKDVGIKYPCRRREVWPTTTIILQYTEILHNVPIDPALFVPPSFDYKIQR
jgi:hypothetical protein